MLDIPPSVAALLDSPSKIVYGCILILVIVYSAVIPAEYKHIADSSVGRLFGIAAVYASIHYLGWTFGLLTAMAFLLILHGGALQSNEGFDGGGTVSEKKVIGNRWWVEKVLGEVPSAVATDRVRTAAPGGNE